MAKAEFGTAKYQAKQLKASGLQKLKFFCQICEKQCRDANGFKNHLNSPSHRGRISGLSESGKARSVVNEYSSRFQTDFLRLLKINHGTKKINANKFYQEYILNDKNHVHMNSTKWTSLTSFIKHLGTNGLVRVTNDNAACDEGFELDIALVDNSAECVQSKARLDQKNQLLATDKEINEKLIRKQIELGKKLTPVHVQNSSSSVTSIGSVPASSSGPVKLSLKSNLAKTSMKRTSLFDDDSDNESDSQDEKVTLQNPTKKMRVGHLTSKLLGKNK
jgi:DNA/RNA-binding protein KIN17